MTRYLLLSKSYFAKRHIENIMKELRDTGVSGAENYWEIKETFLVRVELITEEIENNYKESRKDEINDELNIILSI